MHDGDLETKKYILMIWSMVFTKNIRLKKAGLSLSLCGVYSDAFFMRITLEN